MSVTPSALMLEGRSCAARVNLPERDRQVMDQLAVILFARGEVPRHAIVGRRTDGVGQG